VETYHQQFAALGMYLGPSFKGLERLWSGKNEVLGQVRLVPEIASEAPLYQIHPGMLDPCLQPFAAAALSPEDLSSGGVIYMPLGLESYRVYREPGEALWSHVVVSQGKRQTEAKTTLHCDVSVFDSAGALVAEVRGLSLRRVDRKALEKLEEKPLQDWLYQLTWTEVPWPTQAGRAAGVFIPSPSQITQELRLGTNRRRSESALAEFASLFPRLEALSTHYVYRALSQLGWALQKHERFSTESKATELRVPEKYFRLLGRMLEMLQEDGILQRVDGVWEVCQLPPAREPEMSPDQLLEQFPDCSAELKMTARCGQHLAEAMKGDCDPLGLLFPDGSVEDIERLYRDSPFSRFYNGLIEDAVQALVSRLPSDRPFRVLEIGAGTGSTTASVLPKLPAQRTEYVFTDVTPLFTSKAREKFSSFPFVKYRLLDIEKDPLAQGFEAHSYHIVIAANVLHATPDLRQTLKNIQALLASEGMLLLLEGTRPLRFGDLIVGLTEGWWKFKDTELRPSHALISDRKWQALLADSGFTDVVISPEGEQDGVLANQSLILSRGPRLAGDETRPSTPAPAMSGRWMIFADRGGLGESLCALLKPAAGGCLTVVPGTQYETLGESSYQINAGSPDDFQRLLREAGGSNEAPLRGVVYLWPLDIPSPDITAGEDLKGKIQWGCESLLHLVKALVSEGNSKPDSLWIVTRGTQSVSSAAEPVALAQIPVSAMGSTIGLEFPELHCARIDLDPERTTGEAGDLVEEVQFKNNETLVAFRHGHRHVARLSRVRADSAPVDKGLGSGSPRAYQLQTSSPGMLDRLALQPLERRHPRSGEVEVAVLATGLNFRDVLMALGRYPGGSDVFGYECVGKIVSLGEGVHHFQLGQRVIVMGPGSFASHMTLPADHVMLVPNSLSDHEAATIPSAFLTAHYALSHLGKIAAGDRVLIHAAAGGVGLAAVQLAQRAGAEVFATAGSPQKRAYLKSLGVAHVMDSRSLDFASQIMQVTQGKGVDLVLNSLAGEFIEKSFSVMAANGRFLEIGMTGIWDDARVSQLNRNISYLPINLAATFQQSPRLIADLLHELLKEFAEGRLKPLPLKVFPIDQVVQAFRYMAQARHIGKIVVTHESKALSGERQALGGDATYLITGGLAGLGLLVAQWMVEQGARHLVLTGRSQPSEQSLQVIRGLEQKGAEVVVAQGDVSDRSHLQEVFSKFGCGLPPLRGIVHSAGALDDGVLLHQSWERFQTVFAPKVSGSWQLHALTQDLPLDFFVMFSSAVSLLGSAGQANHVAACAFEDGLAHYRRALGLPALSINWGPWAEVGAATRGTVSQRLQWKGFQAIEPEQGLRVLEELLGQDRVQIGVLSVDWRQYSDSLPRGFRSALLSELSRKTEVSAPSGQGKTEQPQALLQQLNQAPPAKRQKLLLEFLRGQAVKVLGLDSTQSLDYKQPLSDLGLDSLMAVELRSVLSTELGLARSLPATLVFDYPTIAALADYLAEEVLSWEKPQAAKPESPQKEEKLSDILDRIEGLSEEEVNRMYTQEKASKAAK
jgi:NADPH:quinone reductase-like Zn-dependent oxidoreductase/SAM-dependent methyltransferase/acyl carrier protein